MSTKHSTAHRAVLGIFLITAASVLISGCATNGFMGFGDPLTTTSYVEGAMDETSQRITETASSTESLAVDVEAMKVTVEELNTLKAELDEVLATIEQNRKDTEALQSLTARVGERLEELPVEMLRQLVTALQSYLDAIETAETDQGS